MRARKIRRQRTLKKEGVHAESLSRNDAGRTMAAVPDRACPAPPGMAGDVCRRIRRFEKQTSRRLDCSHGAYRQHGSRNDLGKTDCGYFGGNDRGGGLGGPENHPFGCGIFVHEPDGKPDVFQQRIYAAGLCAVCLPSASAPTRRS